MKRGEVWTLREDGYASKARPVVIVQGKIGGVLTLSYCASSLPSNSSSSETRVLIESSSSNGLRKQSYVMTDKILSVAREALGEQIGILSERQMHDVSKQLALLLEITKEDVE